MRIQPIQSYGNIPTRRNNPPMFRSWEREVFSTSKDTLLKELKHRNDTSFFRDGRFWSSLAYYMLYKYRSTDKVNVYNYACSDGSESYSFLMTLIANWGIENAEKFLPIKAMDYDSVAIEKAKSGIYKIRDYESDRIFKLTNEKADMFLDRYVVDNKILVIPKEILRNNVEFKVANILEDYKNIKPENSIVFARNFWPYLKQDAVDLVKKLASQMKQNSTLVLGDYDIAGCKLNGLDLAELLQDYGFKTPLISHLIFEK